MIQQKYDIFTIGPLNLDLHVPYTQRTLEQTHLVDDIKIQLGGGATITTVALATLGRKTAIAGSIGNDISGDIIKNELENVGAETFLKRYPVNTAISEVTIYPDGKKGIVASIRSNELYTPEDLEETYPYVWQSKTVFRTGIPWQPQIIDATIELFDRAKKEDVTTIMSMSNPHSWDPELLKKLYQELVPRTQWLCLNKKELYVLGDDYDPKRPKETIDSYMTPEKSLEYGRGLIERGVDLINLHMGKEGTMLIQRDEYVHERPDELDELSDKTDSFVGVGSGNVQDAGFIDATLNGWNLDEVANHANNVAGLRLRGLGFYI